MHVHVNNFWSQHDIMSLDHSKLIQHLNCFLILITIVLIFEFSFHGYITSTRTTTSHDTQMDLNVWIIIDLKTERINYC